MYYDMQKERALFHRLETEPMMEAQEQLEFFQSHASNGILAIADDRENPIHDRYRFPERWLKDGEKSFQGTCHPDEYYAFQITLYSEQEQTLTGFRWEGSSVPVHCINLGGIDCKGYEFQKSVNIIPKKLQPLWFGLDIPEDQQETVTGTLVLELEYCPNIQIPVSVKISGEPLEDRGDNEPWRHSRLRWLDSRIAIDDEITRPYIPLRLRKNKITGLANEVALADGGLPQQISSRISADMEGISPHSRPVLAGPVTFSDGKPTSTEAVHFVKQKDGIVCWESGWNSGALAFRCEGTMEYDGYQEYRITVTALEDAESDGLTLRLPFRQDTARYWMGLGKRGGLRREELDWKWDVSLNQDTLWMGDVNAGLMVRLRDLHYRKPDMLIYYHYHPLVLPTCWDNDSKGGVRVYEDGQQVLLEAYTGKHAFQKGETLTFCFDLAATPVKPADKREHWLDHYYHAIPENLKDVSRGGANIINIHHAHEQNPYINYPFYETEKLANFVQHCHENAIRAKLYYTVKEMTVHMTEFWAMMSLNGEVFPTTFEIGDSFQGSIPYADEWLKRMLGSDYMTAWRQKINHGCYQDEMEASVVTAPMSRFNNYFLEGLRWLLENTGIDGLYFDDVAFDRSIMKRIRKILDRDHPGCTLDLHSWNYFSNNTVDNSRLAGWANSMNLYIDNFAFLDRIWFGEGFDYDVPPDSWLVEISGIPFGMMGEMLQNGGNVWRGMVFGMTNRLPNEKDPSGIWKLWQDFGMHNAVMLGFWNPVCPIRTNCPDIPVTVYRQPHQCMVALASWSPRDEQVTLEIDWDKLGLDPAKTILETPEIAGFQPKQDFRTDAPIPVASHTGWVLLLREIE